MRDFQRHFSRTLQDLRLEFSGLSKTKMFARTFQVLELSRKKPGLFRRHGNPVKCQYSCVAWTVQSQPTNYSVYLISVSFCEVN